MRLGICALRLVATRTGIARYLENLLREWETLTPPFERVVLFSPEPLPEPHFEQVHGGANWPTFLWQHAWLPAQAKRHGIDLLFCPGSVIPIGYRGRCVVTIHDVLQEEIPEDFPWSSRVRHAPLYRYSARRADRILTDSDASRRGILQHYRVHPDNVVAVPLAADPKFRLDSRDPVAASVVRKRYGLGEDPLILFVGKFSRRRNIPALVEAFALLAGSGRYPHRLVLVGPNHLHQPIEQQAHDLGVGDRVTVTNFVPDDDLVALYGLADLFVYPSEIEGFGLPVLEAMAAGVPTIALRRNVFEEVAGDAITYAEAGTATQLGAAMAALLDDNQLRARLRRRGLERASTFSWTRTAQRTLEVLVDVASRGSDAR